MLKRLVMVGLLVLVGIAAGQNPPSNASKIGITKSHGGSKGKKQPNSQPSDQTTPPPASSSPQPATPTCDETCQQGRQNLQIQNRLVWLTGGLVFVGSLQVFSMIWQAILLRRTRVDVHLQAEHMASQVELMGKQLDEMKSGSEVAKDSADAARVTAKAASLSAMAADESAKAALEQIKAMKQMERARLAVAPEAISSLNTGFFDLNEIPILITNYGATHALNVKFKNCASMNESDVQPDFSDWWNPAISNVIRANESTKSGISLVIEWSDEKYKPVNPGVFVHMTGKIIYEDVFGEEHFTTFEYIMEITRFGDPDYLTHTVAIESFGGWTQCGAPENNCQT